MEYIENGDLGQLIAPHGALAKLCARDIASQILEWLVILHDRGICHGDLKPQVCSFKARVYPVPG